MSTPYFLYAEDDEDDIDILKNFFQVHSIAAELITVKNGFDLLCFLQEVKKGNSYPCLIILDLHMRRLDGAQTLQMLKTDDLYRLIPVIIFSSKASPSEVDYCESLGAEVVGKPCFYEDWQSVTAHMRTFVDA